jgi:hypothetical protein
MTALTWFANMFRNHPKTNDIIRFIRTEYSNDVKHLRDEDVMSFYNNAMLNKRRTKQ